MHVMWVHFQFDSFLDESVHVSVSAVRSCVSCSLITWSWSMLCSATADLSVCVSRIYLLYSFILIWIDWVDHFVLNHKASFNRWKVAIAFPWWYRETLLLCLARILRSQPCHLGVRYQCNPDGSFVGLGSQCKRFKGLSYLLRALSIFLENSGEKFQFLSKGVPVTKSSDSVYQGSQDWLIACRVVKWIIKMHAVLLLATHIRHQSSVVQHATFLRS